MDLNSWLEALVSLGKRLEQTVLAASLITVCATTGKVSNQGRCPD